MQQKSNSGMYFKTSAMQNKELLKFVSLLHCFKTQSPAPRLLTLWEPACDTFVLQFRPKKQQFSVALPTPELLCRLR